MLGLSGMMATIVFAWLNWIFLAMTGDADLGTATTIALVPFAVISTAMALYGSGGPGVRIRPVAELGDLGTFVREMRRIWVGEIAMTAALGGMIYYTAVSEYRGVATEDLQQLTAAIVILLLALHGALAYFWKGPGAR